MQNPISIQRIATKYLVLSGLMDERMSRQWAAAEATAYGWGGARAASRAIGMSPHTVRKGSAELASREGDPYAPIPARIRRTGGGRKSCTESDPDLEMALESLVDPATRGDPQSPSRWTCKSTTRLAEESTRQGHPAGPSTVGRLLRAAGYSLRGSRKTKGGGGHPDRNARSEHINATVKAFRRAGRPVISADTEKRRRNWSGSPRTAGGSGDPAANPRRSASTTPWTRDWARRSPTASTT